MCEGEGNCLKYLERGWKGKEGRENKDFKNGGKAESRDDCLKKEGLEPPYKLYNNADITIFLISMTFLLQRVHIALFEFPEYFCSHFLNHSSCNQESQILVSLCFGILIVDSD